MTDDASRFMADVERLIGRPERLALAVSGGPDSMALLMLAAAAYPGRVVAATVDHRLRAESADEAAMVAAQCAALDVPHAVLVPETPIAGASLQAQARTVRYALLARWAGTRAEGAPIATAHHADDQAETLLMRAARGSGLSGLAGIRADVGIAGARVIRPLLDWRRAELRAIVRRMAVRFVDDPSNHDLRHDRARVRHLLEANEWLDPPRLARAAGALAEADAALRATADWVWDAHATVVGATVTLDPVDLPRPLLRLLVRRAITVVRAAAGVTAPDWSDSANVEPLLDALAAGRRATQGGLVVSPTRRGWRVREAPPRRTH